MDLLTRLWSPPPSRGRVSDRILARWVAKLEADLRDSKEPRR